MGKCLDEDQLELMLPTVQLIIIKFNSFFDNKIR